MIIIINLVVTYNYILLKRPSTARVGRLRDNAEDCSAREIPRGESFVFTIREIPTRRRSRSTLADFMYVLRNTKPSQSLVILQYVSQASRHQHLRHQAFRHPLILVTSWVNV